MTNDERLKVLMDRILRLTPRYGDVMINGIPGMGVPNLDAEVNAGLQRSAARFARAYRDPAAAHTRLQELAHDVEGQVMATVTIGMAGPSDTEAIVELLHLLVRERHGKGRPGGV